MSTGKSRREFLKCTGAGGALVLTTSLNSSCSTDTESAESRKNLGRRETLSRESIEAEIRRRADWYLAQHFLVVDYYRIRRKLAFPLPVENLSLPSVTVPTISGYPWATWMTWELEERVNSLGWAAEWFGDDHVREAVVRDLEALAAWPQYRQYEQPDLSSAHAGRMLWTAAKAWQWVDRALLNHLRAGCLRHVEEVLPYSDRAQGQFHSKEEILALDEPHRILHNIPLIGTLGAALTASIAEHPSLPALNERVQAIFGAILELRQHGFTEGVSYDGYVLDFVADWLQAVEAQERDAILQHPNLSHFLEESYMLTAPGAAEEVAQLSDVEPKEMPFHFSAQAKLHKLQSSKLRAWHLKRWRVDWIRSAGLGALHSTIDRLQTEIPNAGALNAHYAVVLRSGWEKQDLAVVASCTNSPAGHVQHDNGTLLLGTRGRWIITDPGYQQYMRDQEREFTIGPKAHNCPVINGIGQDKKSPSLIALEKLNENLFRTVLDLTSCYEKNPAVESVMRSVWLSHDNLVMVADQVVAESLVTLTYHWHGHPAAAWWCGEGWTLLHFIDVNLWFTSPQAQISGSNIQRLPGSRGQLTLAVEADTRAPVIWWAFLLTDNPTAVTMSAGGREIHLLDQSFAV